MNLKYLIIILLIAIVGCSHQKITGSTVVIESIGEKTQEESQQEVSDVTEQQGEEPKVEEPEIKEVEEESKEQIIEIKDLKFVPKTLEIKPGTTVIWEHKDRFNARNNIIHKIAGRHELFISPRLSLGDTFSFTFEEEGEYKYFDMLYPEEMKGTIIVK